MIRKVEALSIILLCIAVVSLFVVTLDTRKQIVNSNIAMPPVVQPTPQESADTPSLDELLLLSKEYTDQSLATLSASLNIDKEVAIPPATPKTPETYYIPLGASYSTTLTEWTDVPGSETYLDLIGEYGQNAKAFWEINLQVANSNGQAYVRLFDTTHGIAVVGSELSTINNSSFEPVGSGELAIWRGKNLYKVQIKSLNSVEVSQGNARLKITIR